MSGLRPTRREGSAGFWRVDRRDFLRASGVSLCGLLAGRRRAWAAEEAAPRAGVRFGMITDMHYADADPKDGRYYRESLGKTREAVARLAGEKLPFLAVLGDLKDMAPGEPEDRTLSHLIAIEKEIRRFDGPTYHVLGNHDMDNLSKAQVLANITNTGMAPDRAYYSFRRDGISFIVLDANYVADGGDYDHGRFDWRDTHIPESEVDWLRTELAAATEPVVVLAHQRLDGEGDLFVKNSAEVRGILEAAGRVLCVFQGHDHKGAHRVVNGIHYYTLRAVVDGSGPENNSYAVAEIHPDLNITITGYRRAVGMELAHGAAVTNA